MIRDAHAPALCNQKGNILIISDNSQIFHLTQFWIFYAKHKILIKVPGTRSGSRRPELVSSSPGASMGGGGGPRVVAVVVVEIVFFSTGESSLLRPPEKAH